MGCSPISLIQFFLRILGFLTTGGTNFFLEIAQPFVMIEMLKIKRMTGVYFFKTDLLINL